MAESPAAFTALDDHVFEDPSQLSQVLRQRACSDQPFHFTTSTESHFSVNAVAACAIPQRTDCASTLLQLPVVFAKLNHAPSSRRAATANHVTPALPKQHSAPTSTGFSKEAEGVHRMHHSFNGMDAPGDTQPDSQMHKQWTSGVYSTVETSFPGIPKSMFMEHEEDDDDLPTDEMDVVESSQEHHDRTITSPTVIDVYDHAEFAQDSMAPTSPLKFQTPALAGRRRDSSGLMLSSAARTNTTPATVASASFIFPAFGNGGFGGAQQISLTQAFNNTQAPTSPAVGGANEDAVFTRPSPNFTHMRHSSPIPAYSSPIKTTRTETPKSDPIVRSSSEPRTEYVTMKQSQDKRKHSIGDEHSVSLEQDSWEELSRQVKAKKAKEHFHRQAARSLSHISAPTPLLSHSGRTRTVIADYPLPLKSKASRSETRGGPQEEDDSMDDENPQPIMVKDGDTEHFPGEMSQHVPTTARAVAKHNSNDNSVQVPKTSSHPHRTPSCQPSRDPSQQASPTSQLQRESQLRAPGSQSLLRDTLRPQSSKESVAVMDSQPDAIANFDSVPRPKSLRFPSSPSTNQYSINQTTMATKTGYTSQVISSSMPPMPPKSSPEVDVTPEGEERVPSSPPLVSHEEDREGDLEYDEHTYDEYAGVEDREGTEPLAFDEDNFMDEEDDLPVTKEELDDEMTAEVQDNQSDEDELDLIQPGKADLGTDQEVQETLEQEQPEDDLCEDEQSQHDEVEASPQVPRMQRQDTIPETDALDETQPSFSPGEAPMEPVDNDTAMADDTNSTGLFQTAPEEHLGSQLSKLAPVSSKENRSDTIHGDNRIRSIDDIYNLPETQQSAAEEEFEMPRLSGLEDEDEGDFISRSSPAPPSAKRRKLTYTAKRRVFRSPPKAMTDSESLSDPPPSPRLEQVRQTLEDTPPTASIRKREEQSALAVAHVREDVQPPYTRTSTLKSKVLPRPTKPQNQKKGALKSISRELLQRLSSPMNSPAKSQGSNRGRTSTPITPTKSRKVIPDNEPDIDMPDVDDEPGELASPTPQVTNVERILETLSQPSGSPTEDIIVPNRVFASWPGGHYYPATCIGRSTNRQLQTRFDDGNVTSMDAVYVRALDLRKGDHVKVDETGMKKHMYVVVGFKDKIDDLDGEEFPTTDRRGHTTVVLEERPRESLLKSKAVQPAEHISVPITSIYLTAGLWGRLRDRLFNYSPPFSPVKSASRMGTPIADAFTTPSFTRRGTAVPSLLRDAATRAASVASTARSGSGVFTNMAFVLTSTATDVDKEAMAKVIKSNGGQVLEHGFHELFEYASAEVPSSSQNRRRSASTVEGAAGLALKHAYKDLGFVALISDSHSRSTKYIQALALNVPCLHLRWIQDSLTASHAAPFIRYLLPAGVSKFLDPNGVVRSRTMTVYDPAGDDISFFQTIQDRDLLFNDQNVLLVTGKSKKEIEKRQPFIFLSHALGSANVGRCADLAAASEMLANGKWDWLYVDNGERGVAEAAAKLFGIEKPAASAKAKKGKKRKRDESEEKEELITRGEVGGKKVKVTCAEFVIQSLILGALVDE
ncbi:BRCT domain-containing protein [Clathrospora elynae]|uniref:BRCT domain-containing protein n=1 Tax=Clathrospora elynae TaxID=706981 RepID=A0A6A5SE22_9PLEO|nr:BRCT domain-containing protein [Clathrospora elynae]